MFDDLTPDELAQLDNDTFYEASLEIFTDYHGLDSVEEAEESKVWQQSWHDMNKEYQPGERHIVGEGRADFNQTWKDKVDAIKIIYPEEYFSPELFRRIVSPDQE